MLPESISFNSIEGRRDYNKHLHSLYKQTDVAWFTPVELFKPWYGYALAEYILRNHDPEFPLQIFEIGGGAGTCARNILDYIKLKAPSIYESMRYVSVEISNALASKQVKSVHAVRSHKSRFLVECRNACSQSGWGEVDERPCFLIMLEVLDNQPHDLLYKKDSCCPWLETYITRDEQERSKSQRLTEVHKPVQDPLIQRCIEIMERTSNPTPSWLLTIKDFLSKFLPLQKKAWIPTGSLQLLEASYAVHPNMVLIASDFSILPDVKIEGDRAPLVASKKDGVTKDHSTYLDTKGDADIFFPTDFLLLKELDHYCCSMASVAADERKILIKRKPRIMTSAQFMRQFADISKTRTKGGFNPLLDDYSNTSFYLSVSTK